MSAASGSDVRVEVDRFLAHRHKTIPVAGIWKRGNRDGEFRMRLPVERGGEIAALDVEIIVCPDSDTPSLRMLLLYGRAVWRLCLGAAEHPNDLNRPTDLPAMVVGPHHHTWTDNRRFAAWNRLPKNLKNARNLPDSVTTNEEAFAFFLHEVGIDLPEWGAPEWPTRERLL